MNLMTLNAKRESIEPPYCISRGHTQITREITLPFLTLLAQFNVDPATEVPLGSVF